MNVFDLDADLIARYESFARSFTDIRSPDLKRQIDEIYDRGSEPLISEDGSQMWYSRLPETDRGRATDYEIAYAYYIPGDARDALIGYLDCKAIEQDGDAR